MRVSEVLTFNKYWLDARFERKRRNLRGSLQQAYGDNIYHRHLKTGESVQEDSHHSLADGSPNVANVERDTQANVVLSGEEFYCRGASGPMIPNKFRNCDSYDVCAGRGHRCDFPAALVQSFIAWTRSRGVRGYINEPAEFWVPNVL
jgi:hypothetical protein